MRVVHRIEIGERHRAGAADDRGSDEDPVVRIPEVVVGLDVVGETYRAGGKDLCLAAHVIDELDLRRIGRRQERQRDVIAGAALIGDAEGDAVGDEDRALRQTGERAVDEAGILVVQDQERVVSLSETLVPLTGARYASEAAFLFHNLPACLQYRCVC